MSPRFVHLRCHTEYSLVDSLIRVDRFIDAVRAAEMPACAVTDRNNLFALVKFYRAAQSAGIKPIVGVDVWFHNEGEPPSRLLLLCQNDQGYRHLTQLVSQSYTLGQKQGIPYLHYPWLEGKTEGLIALSGAGEGDIGQALLAGRTDQARQLLGNWQRLFPQRFYLELVRIGKPQEDQYIHAAVELATAAQVPVVATNDVCFLAPDDFEIHEVRVCIHDGFTLTDKRRPHRYTPQQYLRTPAEMAELFADIPEAIENSWFIAQRCNLELSFGKNYLPDFPVPIGKTVEEYLHEQTRLGLEKRLVTLFPSPTARETQRTTYEERLQRELQVIEQMGFAGYFLIVADFIQWAKENDIPVGPGRGSGAGSLVAYALSITDLDPIYYELLFERFLNPERVSMPDFDIDFCMEGRDDVIRYVTERYGREKVSQIITYGSMAAKAVVRDVGRVLGHPHGFVDKIAKLIPFELGITLDKALEEESLRIRYQEEEEVRALIDRARKLEGLVRNVGTHAGGVVIAPSALTDFTPLYCEEGGEEVVTQFDKGDVEEIGLVKFDFLGLRTLTVIKWALVNVNRFREEPLDISQLPLDDAATFQLLQQGNTTAVFQLESAGIKRLIRRLRPDCFEDVVALVALYRPGPLQSGMVDDFIDRKHGRARIEYPHSQLEPILKPTYGVILYQEQVMQIAQVLAGYTLGGADLLRRAMGKKKPEEMAKQRSVFVEGAVARVVQETTASYIFDLMEKFAGYGFNRSHSVGYALISYQTAWLKAHYPAAFMAAVLSADMDNTDKVVNLIAECRLMGLKILPPHINRCEYHFTVEDNQNQTMLYGLGAIKGAGEAAISNIVSDRAQNGLFTDLFDLCRRIDLRKANRRVLEPLIKTGALDCFGQQRAVLIASLDTAIKLAEKHALHHTTGQNDMFGLGGGQQEQTEVETPLYVNSANWSESERLAGEKECLGHYLTGHPLDQYATELKQLVRLRLGEIQSLENKQNLRVVGWITDLRINFSKRGRIANITLEDTTGRLEVTLYSELYATVQNFLAKESLLIAEGEVREDKFSGDYSMIANQVLTLDQAREAYAKRLTVTVSAAQAEKGLAQQLEKILLPYLQGQCTVVIHYQRPDAQVELVLGAKWQVRPSEGLLQKLRDLLGSENVRVVY